MLTPKNVKLPWYYSETTVIFLSTITVCLLYLPLPFLFIYAILRYLYIKKELAKKGIKY